MNELKNSSTQWNSLITWCSTDEEFSREEKKTKQKQNTFWQLVCKVFMYCLFPPSTSNWLNYPFPHIHSFWMYSHSVCFLQKRPYSSSLEITEAQQKVDLLFSQNDTIPGPFPGFYVLLYQSILSIVLLILCLHSKPFVRMFWNVHFCLFLWLFL